MLKGAFLKDTMGADEWFKSTQTGQRNKVGSNGSPISSRSAIGAHGLEIVTHHSPLKDTITCGQVAEEPIAE